MLNVILLLLNHFQSCSTTVSTTKSGIFPIWNRSNIFPIHKKGDKQLINNYRPLSLLPICGKIFERLIFISLYEYVEENKLLSLQGSGFRSNNLCVNQLLSIAHSLYKGFDGYSNLKNRGVFGYI